MHEASNRKLAAAAVACAGLMAGVCHAAPSNDNWAGRAVVGALPFNGTTANVEQATSETTDPLLPCLIFNYPTRGSNSVWYEFTTGNAEQFVDIRSSGYNTLLAIFSGSPADGFTMVRGGCNDELVAFSSGLIGLRLAANTRYSIMVAALSPVAAPTTLTFRMTRATVYTVTKTDDTDDGACDADCSLREAVAQANMVPGAIVVPAGTYVVTSQLSAHATGAIYGAGMRATVIKGRGDSRLLGHNYPYDLTYALHDLTLADGYAPDLDDIFVSSGGAFAVRRGYFVLDRVALLDSGAHDRGGAAFFPGNASLSIYDSLIAGNAAEQDGGGIYFGGSNLEIYGSAIVDNEARNGAGSDGGGLFAFGQAGIRLINTTISGNAAAGKGGGVYIAAGSPDRAIIVNNSTIVNNAFGGSAPSPQNGGLIFAGNPTSNQPALITNTVLAGNHLAADPSQVADCSVPPSQAIQSGYSLVEAPNGCTFTAPGDLTGVAPQLLPLSTNGPIPVHMPAAGSPLVDAGDPGESCERTDARGIKRPVDGDADGTSRCDIGAVEKTGPGEGDAIFADSFE